MDIKKRVLSYNLTDSFKVHILLTPSSRKFYLSYRLYSLEKLVSLEESLLISPSISLNEFGSNSVSSLYRSIMGSTSTGYSVMDAFNNQSVYKKLPLDNNEETDYYYSFNSEQELHIDSSNYVFINKDLVNIKYNNNSTSPSQISKTVDEVEHIVFSFISNPSHSTYYKVIRDSNNNNLVSFKHIGFDQTKIGFIKNNNTYETLDIIRDENDVITSIVRKRDNVIVESYSLSLSNNEYLITDNITNNLIKITFDNVKDITSITFGKNNTLLTHSTISFSSYPYYTLVEKSTGQFTYLHKNTDYFDYSFNELGEFNKEVIERVNNDRLDSWKLRKRISLNYNPTITEERSYVQDGYFNNGLSSYSITKNNESSIVNISSNSDTHLSKIIGENVLYVKPASNDVVIVSQEITSFPNGLPNLLAFFAIVNITRVTLKLKYYNDSELLNEFSETLGIETRFTPYIFNLDAPTLTNRIVLSFEIRPTLSRSSFYLGAIRLTRENYFTIYDYNTNDGLLTKSFDVHNETKFNYQDRELTSISNSNGYSSSFYYENKTLKEVSNPYGGISNISYDSHGYTNKVKVTSPIEGDESYMESSSLYDNDELIQEVDENNIQTNYEYESNSPSLQKINDSVLETSFNNSYSNKESITSFKGINQTSLYSSNTEKYNNNYSLQTLTTNNFGYRYNYLADNNLASVVCGSTPVPIFGQPLVSYSYQTNEYLSKDLISSKTINNTTYNFSYSDNGLLTSISNSDNTLFSFTYDVLGNITRINELESQIAHIFNYNINGDLIRESHGSMFVKEYVYDFENLMYTRVNDSIEDRIEFESNNDSISNLLSSSFINLKNEEHLYLGYCNTSQNVFALRNLKGVSKNPINSSWLPTLELEIANYHYLNFNGTGNCGLVYTLYNSPNITFGASFFFNESSHMSGYVNQICSASFGTSMKASILLIYDSYGYWVTLSVKNNIDHTVQEYPVAIISGLSKLHSVSLSIAAIDEYIVFKFVVDGKKISITIDDVYVISSSNVTIVFGHDSGVVSTDRFDGQLLFPFISDKVLSDLILSSIFSFSNIIHKKDDRYLRYFDSIYSYKNIPFANYFPLKNCLCSKNISPIKNEGEENKNPTFIYDEIKHHNVLNINNTKVRYPLKSLTSNYVFFEVRILSLNEGNTPLLTFVNSSIPGSTLRIIVKPDNLIKVIFNGTEYSSTLNVPIDGWFTFAVSIQKINNNLNIELRVNNGSGQVTIPSNLSFDMYYLGSYEYQQNETTVIDYLNGNIENLVYGTSYLFQVTYNQLRTAFKNSFRYKESTYDIFGRLSSNESFEFNHNIKTNYEYKSLNNKQTTLINKETHLFDDSEINEYNYQYKANGKLRLLSLNNGDDIQYEYDSLGRISHFLKTNDISSDLSINYQYDTYGNITSITKRVAGNSNQTTNFIYDSTNPTLLKTCGDKGYNYNGLYLISSSTRIGTHFLNDTTYSYIGNKLSNINQLGGLSISFKYGYNGFRNKKIIETYSLISGVTSTTEISYVYDGDKLILENHPDYQLRFQYDSLGKLLSIEKYNLNNEQLWKYYYIVSIFNDVLGLVNESGEQVVSYLYDPFGNEIVSTVLSSEDSFYHNNDLDVFAVNPFKYKSYYYDVETSLYYLTTRYYDPNIGRFISPDSVDYLEPNELSGLNLFTYCGNDPVNYCDPSGHSAILIGLLIGTIIGIAAGVGYAAYTDYSDDNSINGSIGAGSYIGYGLLGGVAGGLLGAGIGYALPALSTFAASSFTIGGSISISGGAAVLSTGITITGAQALEGVGILVVGIMASIIGKSGGYTVKKFPNDHDPAHVHIFGDDISDKAHGIRIGLDGKPLPGQGKLPPGAKRALKKLWELILKSFLS